MYKMWYMIKYYKLEDIPKTKKPSLIGRIRDKSPYLGI